MPTLTTRRRRSQPSQVESLFNFCCHCEGQYSPTNSPVEGVCETCAEELYFICDECGTYHRKSLRVTTSSNRTLCSTCAERFTFRCADCGCIHEHSERSYELDRDNRIICDECLSNYTRCDGCNRLFRSSDIRTTATGDFCWSCSSYESGRAIMSYSFKPEPRFIDVTEPADDGLFLGIELEMDHGHAEACASRIRDMFPDKLYFKHDGSLDNGCEFVTHPMSPAYLMSDAGKQMWRDITDAAIAEGMKSHDTTTCGLHVHVSRDFFGKTGTAQEITELKLIELVDRLYEPIVLFSRRKRNQIDRWAPKCNAPKSQDSWRKKAKAVSDYAKRDRYHAVNIANEHTIEFRIFRGTLKPETILATLQFVTGLCHLAKKLNPSQMGRIDWYTLCDEVMDACPHDTTELYEYLVCRELIVAREEM